jgi:hypothetical protein
MGAVIVLLCWVPGTGQNNSVPPLQRIVDVSFPVGPRINVCSVPTAVWALGKLLRIPTGSEYLPGECDIGAPSHSVERIDLQGKTVEQALDVLIALDGRYRWIESKGVIVVRPLTAWADPKHILNHISAGFVLDEQHLGGALDEILVGLIGASAGRLTGAHSMRTAEGERRISLTLGAVSLADTLNAIVREHGASRWQANFSHEPPSLETMTLWLNTFDGDGIGRSTKSRANGDRE